MATVPGWCAGVVTVIEASLRVTIGAVRPSNVTLVTLASAAPSIVTLSPPAAGPDPGETLTTIGVGSATPSFVYVQRLARPQKAPVSPSCSQGPGQRTSMRYAAPAVRPTIGTLTPSCPAPMSA